MSEHDLVDVAGGNAGICQRLGRDLDDEAFHGLGIEFAEWRVRPSDDAGSHGRSPWFTLRFTRPKSTASLAKATRTGQLF